MINFIRRSWPGLFETDVRKLSERDCQEWLAKFQRPYAPSVVNEAVTSGARFGNPAANLARMDVKPGQARNQARA